MANLTELLHHIMQVGNSLKKKDKKIVAYNRFGSSVSIEYSLNSPIVSRDYRNTSKSQKLIPKVGDKTDHVALKIKLSFTIEILECV